MRIVLEVTAGPETGRRFQFEERATFVVGRSQTTDVGLRILGDRAFSRHHFMLEVDPPKCFLRDLNSTNHTFVNGREVRQVYLDDGDVIRGGRTEMTVHVEQAQAAQTEVLDDESKAAPAPAPGVKPGAAAPPTPRGGRVAMDTTLRLARPGELRCAICGKLADDTHLKGLTDTRMVTHICSECRAERWDPKRPIPLYDIVEELRPGSLGPIFRARRTDTGRDVLLKMITPRVDLRDDATALFLREMEVCTRLSHPNIVPLIELGECGPDLWVAMEYVDGVDAADLTRQQGGRLPVGDAVTIVTHVLNALDYAHTRNVVHRDVKPPNILVTGDPGARTARLADFGLAKNMDEAGLSGITREGDVRGTVPFMPPEQVLDCRFVRPQGDLYQAAATAYWLMTGEYVHDFDATDGRGVVKDPFVIILEDPIRPLRDLNASVPPAVAAAIERALAKDPEDRFASAGEMARALRASSP